MNTELIEVDSYLNKLCETLASSLIAQVFSGPRSLKALGTYNFAGDIGKMTVPALASLMFVVLPWREAVAMLGGVGILVGVVIFMLMPRLAAVTAEARKGDIAARGAGAPRYGFPLLLSVWRLSHRQ